RLRCVSLRASVRCAATGRASPGDGPRVRAGRVRQGDNMGKLAIGVDFGTESGRAVLVDVETGRQVATAVHAYANGVIDDRLPLAGRVVRLGRDWALQDPDDYLEVFRQAVPAVLRLGNVDPADVIGVGIDFTACTML